MADKVAKSYLVTVTLKTFDELTLGCNDNR